MDQLRHSPVKTHNEKVQETSKQFSFDS